MKASGHFPPLAAPRDTALFPTTSVCTQQAQGQRRNCSRCAGIKGQIAGSAYGVLYKSPMDPLPSTPPLPLNHICPTLPVDERSVLRRIPRMSAVSHSSDVAFASLDLFLSEESLSPAASFTDLPFSPAHRGLSSAG